MIEKSVSLWLPQLQENDDDVPEVKKIKTLFLIF